MKRKIFHRRGRRDRRVNPVVFLGVLCVLCGGIFAQDKKTVQTPFGPTVRQAGTEAPRPPDFSMVRVEEKGDTITFRRRTPFGDSVWTRQRGELTPLEREILAARDPKTKKGK